VFLAFFEGSENKLQLLRLFQEFAGYNLQKKSIQRLNASFESNSQDVAVESENESGGIEFLTISSREDLRKPFFQLLQHHVNNLRFFLFIVWKDFRFFIFQKS